MTVQWQRDAGIKFMEWVEAEYAWLLDDKLFEEAVTNGSPEERKLLKALRGCLMLFPTLEDAVSEFVGLAMVSTEEAEKFEKAVMSDPEGREVVDRIYRQRPHLFSDLLGYKGRPC